MEVLSDLVLELAVHRVLGESEAQVLADVTSYGGIYIEETEGVGGLREREREGHSLAAHFSTSTSLPHYHTLTLTLSDYLAF